MRRRKLKPYFETSNGQLFKGEALGVLSGMKSESIQCCITSPPYWGLRDYDVEGQLGLEKTLEEYVSKVVEIFREVKRILRKDGTLWLNLGDSYNANQGSGFDTNKDGRAKKAVAASPKLNIALPPKNLVGIPWMVAFALRQDGWFLRQDIIWHKPNPMPESCTDRCTKAHEYIFLMSKSAKYFYDSEAIKVKGASNKWGKHTNPKYGKEKQGKMGSAKELTQQEYIDKYKTVNKRSVWTVPTKPFSGAHFATFPPALITPCVLAGTSKKGCCAKCGAPWERVVENTKEYQEFVDSERNRKAVMGRSMRDGLPGAGGISRGTSNKSVSKASKTIGWQPTCNCKTESNLDSCIILDPFIGSGTAAVVCERLNRKWVGIELKKESCEMAKQRIKHRGKYCESPEIKSGFKLL